MFEPRWEMEIEPASEEAWLSAVDAARASGETYVACTVTFTQMHPPGPLNPEPIAGFRVSFELAPFEYDDVVWQGCWRQSLETPGAPLEASDVEQLPLGSLLTRAIEASRVVRTHRNKVKFKTDLTDAERQALEDRRRAQARTPQKGQPVTDDQLQHVAELYRHRLATGSKRPTQDLADMLDIPRPTIARWLVDARKRGLLSQGRRDQEV